MSSFLMALGLLLAVGWGYRLMARLERFMQTTRFSEDDE